VARSQQMHEAGLWELFWGGNVFFCSVWGAGGVETGGGVAHVTEDRKNRKTY